MAVILRDEHLEGQIDKERERRGDRTMAKTLGDLVREKLTEIQRDRVHGATDEPEPAAASA